MYTHFLFACFPPLFSSKVLSAPCDTKEKINL